VVVTIRLNRPPMNVLSDRLQAELADAVGRITTDAALRAVLLYGGPCAVAAGADIKRGQRRRGGRGRWHR
jgi:enoyl-CoA hydratase/carnithine racemase